MGTGRLFACSLVRHKTDGHRHRYQVQQPHYITWRYHRYNTEFLVKDTGTIICTWKYNIMVHASSNSRCLLTAQNKRQLHNRNSGRKIRIWYYRICLPSEGLRSCSRLNFSERKKKCSGSVLRGRN